MTRSATLDDKLVIALAGYTKARKSTLARIMCSHAPFRHLEMSDLIREQIHDHQSRMNVEAILRETERIRAAGGRDSLARHVYAKMLADCDSHYVIAGLRAIADYRYLRANISNFYVVYVHCSPDLRYHRLDTDPTSVAKTRDEYISLDEAGEREGIRDLAPHVDYFLITDSGFPLTPLEQLFELVCAIKRRSGIEIPWKQSYDADYMTHQQNKEYSTMKGYRIEQIPTFKEDIPEDGPAIARILKSRGELANISYDSAINYIAYVEFPLDGVPRANHFHEEKVEQMYLISGKIRGFYRRANAPEAEVFEEDIEAGSLVTVDPGWVHAYITIEPGHAIEFSTSGQEIIAKDKVRQPIA